MNDLEARSAELREELTQCRDPQRNTALQKELQSTMQAIADSQPAPSHHEEIEALRSSGQRSTADAMQQQLAVNSAEADLREAENRLHSSTGLAHSNAERALQTAQKALEQAQSPTPMRAAQIERDRLYAEANELSSTAALLKRSPIPEERLRGDQMNQEASDKMEQFYETRVVQ